MLDDNLKRLRQLARRQWWALPRAVLSVFMILAASGGIASLARGAEAQLVEQEFEEEADETWGASVNHNAARLRRQQAASFAQPLSALSNGAVAFGTSAFTPTGHFLFCGLRAPLRC